MPKGGKGGGGGSGGGPGGDSDGGTWKGTRGDDYHLIADEQTFLATSYDGGSGEDELDFSNIDTGGITIWLNGSGKFQGGWVNLYQGYKGEIAQYADRNQEGALFDTIKGVESITATNGDDYVHLSGTDSNFIDGLGGNDSLEGASLLIGGTGSDSLRGYDATLVVGGEWDETFAPQVGDRETDTFKGGGIILDFELGIDELMIGVYVDLMDAILAAGFVEGSWTDEFGQTHDAAQLYSPDRGDLLYTLVGITADVANSQILQDIRFEVGGNNGVPGPVYGSSGDDFFTLRDAANEVVFLTDGGNDVLRYYDSTSMSPEDDILYFESNAPTSWEDWTHSTINGVDVWTYDYGSGTATVSGLDQAAFQQLTFALGLPEGLA